MDDVIFLLDGHFSRLIITKLFGVNATPFRLQSLCISSLHSSTENPLKAFYYDCKPFHQTKQLPISKASIDFSRTPSALIATRFQEKLCQNSFFVLRLGRLSFDGWKVSEEAIDEFSITPKFPEDSHFKPALNQKRVDMMIGMDMTEIALNQKAKRILLFTADDDFTPAIEETRKRGLDVVLVTGGVGFVKKELIKACNDHRDIDLTKLEGLLKLPLLQSTPAV
jgi:uncharacterized LabA/DUF88 family protein